MIGLTGNAAFYPIIVAIVVAVVQAFKQQFPKIAGNWTVLLAAVLGGLIGLIHLAGIDPVTGIALGLSAVGIHTVAQNIGTSAILNAATATPQSDATSVVTPPVVSKTTVTVEPVTTPTPVQSAP